MCDEQINSSKKDSLQQVEIEQESIEMSSVEDAKLSVVEEKLVEIEAKSPEVVIVDSPVKPSPQKPQKYFESPLVPLETIIQICGVTNKIRPSDMGFLYLSQTSQTITDKSEAHESDCQEPIEIIEPVKSIVKESIKITEPAVNKRKVKAAAK